MKKRAYQKGARAESEARTRQSLLDAAVASFSEMPFELVTVNAIAARAAVSVQTLLRIHGTKEDLFVAAVESIGHTLIGKRSEVPPGELDSALRALIDDYERYGEVHEHLFARARHLPSLAALFDSWRIHHRRWVRRIFSANLEPLERADRAELLALLTVALDIGTYRRLRADGLSRALATRAVHRLASALIRA